MVTDKIYLAAKDLNEPKYQLLIKKFEEAGIYLKEPDPNIFTEYSNTVDDDYDNYSLKRKRKNISVFDTMITDINTNKNFQVIAKELFMRCRKLNISLAFITKSYFFVAKEIRLNSMHYLIMNNP